MGVSSRDRAALVTVRSLALVSPGGGTEIGLESCPEGSRCCQAGSSAQRQPAASQGHTGLCHFCTRRVPPQVGSLPRWGLDMLLVRSNCSLCVSVGLNVELWMASAGPPSRNAPSGRCTFWGSESWAWGVLRPCRMPSSGLLGMVGGHCCCSLEHRRCPGSSLWGGGLARVH